MLLKTMGKQYYRIAGNFRARKVLTFCCYLRSFLCKIWGCGIFWRHQRATHAHKNRIFHRFVEVFSLKWSLGIWYARSVTNMKSAPPCYKQRCD